MPNKLFMNVLDVGKDDQAQTVNISGMLLSSA